MAKISNSIGNTSWGGYKEKILPLRKIEMDIFNTPHTHTHFKYFKLLKFGLSIELLFVFILSIL